MKLIHTIYAVLVLVVVVLLSCSTEDNSKEFVVDSARVDTNFEIKLMLHPSDSELQKAYRVVTSTDGSADSGVTAVDGFNRKQGNICTIFMIIPNKVSREKWIDVLGHETAHCILGQWHSATGALPSKIIIR